MSSQLSYACSRESGIQADDVGSRRSVSSSENMLVSQEPSFVYSKGKPVSSWLISKSSNIFLYKSSFCTSNLRPVFCFAVSSALQRLSLLTGAYTTPTSSARDYGL